MTVTELQAERKQAFDAAEKIVTAAETQKRPMSGFETSTFDRHMHAVRTLDTRIAGAKPVSASRPPAEIRSQLNGMQPRRSHATPSNDGHEPRLPETLSREYHEAFYNKLSGQGPINASLYEAVSTTGGNLVPILVEGRAVPLSPQDSAVRRLSTQVVTKSDLRNPTVLTRATAAAKAETSAFATAQQTLGSFTLSAYPIGLQVTASLELFEDVDLFSAFLLSDAVSAFMELEESYFLSGSGNGQPQGLLGSVGAGVTTEPDTAGNIVSVDAIWALIASLKETYYSTASFLMTRTTALGIRRAQIGSGSYFEPIFRRENGVDTLAGFPLSYSSQMPTAARAATPVLFGAFDRGYIVGDRQGPALLVKVLDGAASTLSGLRDILFFRRTDGRVKDVAAIQGLTIAAS